MTLGLDKDVEGMSLEGLQQALMTVRQAVRVHRDATDNDRCFHNDLELYGQILPENDPPGQMNQRPKAEYLVFCGQYIDGQQCDGTKCRWTK